MNAAATAVSPQALEGSPGNRVIVAVDVSDAEAAVRLVGKLRGLVGGFKVGLELFHAVGPSIFSRLHDAGAERIWYDGKFNDIPNTVAGAAWAVARHRLWMLNVHCLAGRASMEAAADAAEQGARQEGAPRPLVLGVTLLTSLDQAAVNGELGIPGEISEQVVRLARLAQQSKLDGVVASAQEAAAIRRACGPDFLIATPGIRSSAAAQDQKRRATPREAVSSGADYLVLGREITSAADPAEAAMLVAAELRAG